MKMLDIILQKIGTGFNQNESENINVADINDECHQNDCASYRTIS